MKADGIASHRPEHEGWPAFEVCWNDNSPGPTDVSALLRKPAGASGYVRVVDGHLAEGDDQRLRLWGLNICTDMPLPPMDLAPIVTRRLAKYGVNCLRLHAIDHRWPNGILMRVIPPSDEDRGWGGQNLDTRSLDPEALARLDFFVYCCKELGIYLDLNLNVARRFSRADGVRQADQVRWGKGVTYFDPQLVSLQKEYARQLLMHTNPFTGVRYSEEPAIAIIELLNENSLLEYWVRGFLGQGEPTPERGNYYNIPSSYVIQLDRMWNNWLVHQYHDRKTLHQAWDGDLRDYEDPGLQSVRRLTPELFAAASALRFQDEARFYMETEKSFFADIQTFLRDELGVQQLILGTSDHNQGWSALPMLATNATLDVMDGHMYWQHPRSHRPGFHWRRDDWYILNSPMVDEPERSIVSLCSRSAVSGMPYIISECNEPFPNDYASEFIPITAAYALLQDWDGIFFYDFDGSWGSPYWHNEEWRSDPDLTTFALGSDPVKWTQMVMGALMFLRGDIASAEQAVDRSLTQDVVLESLLVPVEEAGGPYWIPGLPGRLALVHRTRISEFDAEAMLSVSGYAAIPDTEIVSDTGELTWHSGSGVGAVIIDAPRHQAIIGRAANRATSNLALALETSFAAVMLTSVDDEPIAAASRLLLSATARVANTGMRWADKDRTTLGEQWGDSPIRIEPVIAALTLRGLENAARVSLQPLDGRGQPLGDSRLFHETGEGFSVELNGEPGTPWYLITVTRDV